MISALVLIVGLVMLIAGTHLLLRGARRLTSRLDVPPIVVGLTVVAYGTSLPEFLVSLRAVSLGTPAVALGNVVGSNIFNVLFILGAAGTVVPLVVSRVLVRRDFPLVIGLSVLVASLSLDGILTRPEGMLLLVGLPLYTLWALRTEAGEPRTGRMDSGGEEPPLTEKTTRGTLGITIAIFTGLILLTLGAEGIVRSATALARRFGLSEGVIGLTLVAGGTSLPELATSLGAAFRGQRDVAVGNVVGSNLFNLTGVLGGSVVLAADALPVSTQILTFDLPFMVVVTVVCLPILLSEHRIVRWEAMLLLGYYVLYVVYLVGAQRSWTAHPGPFSLALFVLPLAFLMLAAVLPGYIRLFPGDRNAR